jgi:hypothetical protein
MSTPFVKRYYQVPRAEIGYLRFILESYDGLIFMRTLDPHTALIEVAHPLSRRPDAEALLLALASEVSMDEVPAPLPENYPPL